MSNNEMFKSNTAILSEINYFEEIVLALGDATVSYIAEETIKKIFKQAGEEILDEIPIAGTICSVASLLVEAAETVPENPLQYVDPDTWFLNAGTAWTCSYIEIYDTSTSSWYAVQCSSYARMEASMYGPYVYDPDTNAPEQLGGIVKSGTVYSTYYSATATRKLQAVQAYLGNYIHVDGTGDIEYYFSNPNDPTAIDVLIFTHEDIVIVNS